MNLCLYGPSPRWTMTERGRHDIRRDPAQIAIGPSRLSFERDSLVAEIDERATPLPRPAVGTIRVIPEAVNRVEFPLDAAGRHIWRSPAPAARVELAMRSPDIRWSGHAYIDMNWGSEPLETGFRHWHWSRSRLAGGRSVVFFDGVCRTGPSFGLALRFDEAGRPHPIEVPAGQRLPRTMWFMPRRTRADAEHPARIDRTLEDTPFYARSILKTRLLGENVAVMHESLDLDRFASRWVQSLLPYRMPRRPSGGPSR